MVDFVVLPVACAVRGAVVPTVGQGDAVAAAQVESNAQLGGQVGQPGERGAEGREEVVFLFAGSGVVVDEREARTVGETEGCQREGGVGREPAGQHGERVSVGQVVLDTEDDVRLKQVGEREGGVHEFRSVADVGVV